MTEVPAETDLPHGMLKVLGALGDLGEATAAAVAEHAEVAYSTATAKLRNLENMNLAEPFHPSPGRTLWRLTGTSRPSEGQTEGATAIADGPPGTSDQHPAAAEPPAEHSTAVEVTEAAVPESEPQVMAEASGTERPDSDSEMGAHAVGSHDHTASAQDGDPQPAAEPAPTEAANDSVPTTPVAMGANEVDSGSDNPSTGTGTGTGPARTRRGKGSLRTAILAILKAHPDRQYKTSELCKLIDRAEAGTGANKAGAGAVANAATKLVADGVAVQTVDQPATYQLAPTSSSQ
ncbi:hypothetical protein C1I95_28760 [Micromonospora craterilacus]|uniref:Uncharacterized protein n=1 Tax=Micromonospora craterilacus TaxID=1655439 RepID=A0A2W2F090_9ACTN|nr:MarR family transcriptional regulator [Micromonospora craterilacus]PZG09664.1 hypothetical protein C1I95_28760 [Micromonospora craterilacus]